MFSQSGTGDAIFSNSYRCPITFSFKVLRGGGQIVGTLVIKTKLTVALLGSLPGAMPFLIEGTTNLKRKVLIRNCYGTNILEKYGKRVASIKVNFIGSELSLDLSAASSKPAGNLKIEYYVLNMHETAGLRLKGQLSEMEVAHDRRISEYQKIMNLYATPLITSTITMHLITDGTQTLGDIANHRSPWRNFSK